MKKLTLVIPTFNRVNSLAEFINAIKELIDSNEIAIIIADSSTDSKTKTYIKSLNLSENTIKYIEYENIELYKKQIDMIKYVTTDYFCICADSYIFNVKTLQAILRYLDMSYDLLVLKNANLNELSFVKYKESIEIFKDLFFVTSKFNSVIIKSNIIDFKYLSEIPEGIIENYLNYMYVHFNYLSNKINALYIEGKIEYTSKNKKNPWWSKDERFFKVWIKDYVDVINMLDDKFDAKKVKVLRDRFCINKKATVIAFLSLREKGYYDSKVQKKYKSNLRQLLSIDLYIVTYVIGFVPCFILAASRKVIGR